MNVKQLMVPVLVAALSGFSMAAGAADLPLRLLGEVVPAASASRTVVIDADTAFVRITGGETVQFIIGDKRFTWQFDGPEGPFTLNDICPTGMLKHQVRGYVEPNPLYTG